MPFEVSPYLCKETTFCLWSILNRGYQNQITMILFHVGGLKPLYIIFFAFLTAIFHSTVPGLLRRILILIIYNIISCLNILSVSTIMLLALMIISFPVLVSECRYSLKSISRMAAFWGSVSCRLLSAVLIPKANNLTCYFVI